MKVANRKTRSDGLPLTRHPTGQYCKRYMEKYVTSALTRKKYYNNVSIRPHFCMDMITIQRHQPIVMCFLSSFVMCISNINMRSYRRIILLRVTISK